MADIPTQRLPTQTRSSGPSGGPAPAPMPAFADIGAFRQRLDVSGDTFGAGIARANIQAGEQLSDAAVKAAGVYKTMTALRDETEAKDADIKFSQALSDLEFNPQTGFNSLRGKDAVDAYPKISTAVQDLYAEHRDALSNDNARKMFDSVAVRRATYASNSMMSHTAQENRRWVEGTAAARIENEIDQSALVWNDDVKFRQSLGTIASESADLAQLRGLSPEQTEAMTRDSTSKAWAYRINAASKTDAPAAEAMFAAARPQLEARTAAAIEQSLVARRLQQEHAAEIQAARSERLYRQGQDRADEAAQNKYIKAINSDDQNPIVQQIINDPTLKPQHKLVMLSTVARAAKDPVIRTDPVAFRDYFDRIHLPDGDPRKITNPIEINEGFVAQRLSYADMEHLRKEVLDARTPEGQRLGTAKKEFLSGVKQLIDKSNPLMGQLDQEGPLKLYEFGWKVDREIEAARAAGKNPYDLFDPSKPEYLGKPEALAPFQKTLQDSQRAAVQALRRGQPPKPGEQVPPPVAPPGPQRPPLGSFFKN